MSEIKNQTIAWMKRNFDSVEYHDECSLYGKYLGHRVRYNRGLIQIGYADFDRWANSVSVEFDAPEVGLQKALGIGIEAARADKTELSARVFNKMMELARAYP